MRGRAAEMDQVGRALRRADLVGVVLTGDAGVGKSALLGEAVTLAEAEGFCVVRLFGSRATSTLPLCAFSSFLEPGGEAQPVERFIAVRQALAAHASHRPLLISVDDAHLLDDASAVLISQLARELAAFVLCTVRTGEPAPESLSSLWVQGSATLVPIGPLAREVAAELAGEILGGPLSPDLAAALWKRAAGNPLFLRELVHGSLASGAVTMLDGSWSLVGPLASSTALADLIGQRFAALSEAHRHALCCVALSEPASVGLIEAVADPDTLIALEESGLVIVTQDRRRLVVRLAHPLYGEVVRAQTSQLRARRIRRALADAVMTFGARRHDDGLSVATWRLDCGDVDATQFAHAAFAAIRLHDTDLAERLAAAAHEHEPSELTARALAMTRHMLGRHDDALDTLIEPLSSITPGSAVWARVGLLDGLVRARGVGDYPGARAVLARVAVCETSPRTLRRADAMTALIELLEGDAAASRTRSGRLVADGAPEAEAYTALIGATAANGAPAVALQISNAFTVAHGVADPRSLFPDFRWVALLDAGELDEMANEVSDAWEHATDLADRHRQARAALACGHMLLDRGQATAARRWFDTAAGLSRLTGERFGERWALSGSVLAASLLGDVADAETCLEALELIPSHPAAFFEVYGKRGRAWLDAARGDTAGARARLIELADELLAGGCVSHAVRALLDVARLGDPSAALQRVARLENAVDGRALPAFIGLIQALTSKSADALIASADELTVLGYSSLAAEAASAARDALAKAGRARDASGWARRAGELAAATDGGVTPLFTVIESVVPLTRREREIAALVAVGRTSREVADACFLSVRTVETHLARVYDKLGVRGRGELGAALSTLMASAA